MEHSIARGTKDNYNQHLSYWFRFCAVTFDDPLEANYSVIEKFIGYLFVYTDVNGDKAGRVLTALHHHFIENKVEFYRPKWMTHLLRGFRELKPKKLRPKRPFCHILMHHFAKYVYARDDFLYNSIWLGMMFGYFGGMRPGEYSKTRYSKTLKMKQITWNPSADNPKEVIITLTKSKTNRFGERQEQIVMGCKCTKKRFGCDSLSSACVVEIHFAEKKEI